MRSNDNSGAAEAPTAKPSLCRSLSAHRQYTPVSYTCFVLAVLLLAAQTTTAQPWDGASGYPPDHHSEEDDKAHFAPYLHGPDVLPDGAQWLLFQEHWRAVGNHLATPNFTNALENAASIIYSQYSFHGVYAGSHVSHASPVILDGRPGGLQTAVTCCCSSVAPSSLLCRRS